VKRLFNDDAGYVDLALAERQDFAAISKLLNQYREEEAETTKMREYFARKKLDDNPTG
jgi:hypothetical protein